MNLEKLTKKELQQIAKEKNVKGIAKMTKPELIAAISPLFDSDKKEENLTSSQPGYSVQEKPAPKAEPKKEEYPIPDYYNVDTLNFMPVDPSKEYAFWEISDYTFNRIKSELRLSHSGLLLKVYKKENNTVIEAASVSVERIGNWYFNIYAPDSEMWAEIGLLDSNGAFHAILKSNQVTMPADKVSSEVDQETWMTLGGETEKLYELSGAGQREKFTSRNLAAKEMIEQMQHFIGSSGVLKDK